MYVDAHEIYTPKRTLLGNAAWLLLHTAPYEAATLTAGELRAEDGGAQPHAAFAARYATLADAVVAAYPCCSCRRHAVGLRPLLLELKQYAASLRGRAAAVSADEVADELAIFAFKLHNWVNAASAEPGKNVYALPAESAAVHEFLTGVQDRTMAGLQERMEAGTLSRAYVARVLRARWQLR